MRLYMSDATTAPPPHTYTYTHAQWSRKRINVGALLDEMRREAFAARKLWDSQGHYQDALDELRMSQDRMRYAIPGEEVEEYEQVRLCTRFAFVVWVVVRMVACCRWLVAC